MRKSFLILILSFFCIGATINYQADFLWVIRQFEFPNKNLKLYLIDTRQGMVKIFSDYATANNLVIKPYGLAAVRTSTGAVLKMFFFSDLASLKDKVVNYCQTNNISFAWKPYQSGNIANWWLQKQ